MPTKPRFGRPALPDESGAETSVDDTVVSVPKPFTRVAAFGDSLMWGQGIPREQRFSFLAGQEIGKLRGRPLSMVHDKSRSGAIIKIRRGADREDFVNDYPTFFEDQDAVRRWLEGKDEGAALQLYGEVPCSFPTIVKQVDLLAPKLGSRVDVSMVCGGANDINFEALLDSTENRSAFVDKFAGSIREICFQDTLELLAKVREKTPNAVILLFGYHSPMSYRSSESSLKSFFKHELDDTVKWYLNGGADFLGIPSDSVIDVDKAILEARVRSVWAQGLSTYWLRRAVNEANQDGAVRGPGVIFVPNGFKPSNAAFATEPFVADDYTDPTSDPVRQVRHDAIPRIDALQDLEVMYLRVSQFDNFKGAKALREKIDGPTALEASLFSRKRERGRTPEQHLAAEIYRIKRALIASFFHPNPQGARQISRMATARYASHEDAIAALPKPGVDTGASLGGEQESFKDRLKRFGLRGGGPLRADVGHDWVDAVRVRTSTGSGSTPNLPLDLWLVFILQKSPAGRSRRLSVRLTMQYVEKFVPIGDPVVVEKFHPELEPRHNDEFTADVAVFARGDGLRLFDVEGIQLVLGSWDHPGTHIWRPDEVSIDINGVEVATRDLRGTEVGARGSVDLRFPAPAPKGRPPVFESTAVRLAKRTNIG